MLPDDDLAVHRNIFDARIKIWDEERLFYMEILKRELCLLIHLTGTCGNCIETHGLLQMCISDR